MFVVLAIYRLTADKKVGKPSQDLRGLAHLKTAPRPEPEGAGYSRRKTIQTRKEMKQQRLY